MRSALRSFVGPIVLAIGCWCAAGAVALPSAEALSARVLVPPPWWLFLAALGAAGLVPACRRRPVLATPALLSVLPWLPIRVPAVALIWTGRLAWVPVGLAVIALIMDRRQAAIGAGPDASIDVPRRPMLVAAALTALAVVATALAVAPRLPGGDEPHYLIITQSLLEDGDLRIENNHRARDYASYFRGTLDPDFLHRGRNEVIYSIHAPGLPVLVAPLFAAFGYRGAQATVMLCAVLTGALIWAAGWLATRSSSAAWFAWAAITSSLTFLLQGVSIFPDGPAATIVAASTVVLLWFERRRPVNRGTLVMLSAALAALPFLHTRLATISAGVGAAVTWALATEASRSTGERRHRILTFLALPAVGLLAWLGYFQILYGTPNPAIAYGTHPETRMAYIPGGVLGLLFDQDFGLLAFAPLLGVASVGWWRREGVVATARWMWLPALLYLSAVGSYWMWWGGTPATPARFAAAIVPVLAPALAVAWTLARRAGRTVLTTLAAMTMAMTAVMLGVHRGELAWNTYDAHVPWLTWLSTSVALPRGLPSFFWNLDPGVVASEWPFVVHVVVLVTLLTVSAVVLRALARRSAAPEAVGAWAVAGVLMACVQVGWWVTGASPLQPIGAQLRLLVSMADGAPARLLSAAHPLGRSAQIADLLIDVPRTGLASSPGVAWMDVRLPMGSYAATVVERRPVGGTLTVTSSDGAASEVFALAPQTEQTVALSIGAGGAFVSFEPDSRLAAAGPRLSLRPIPPVGRK